MNLRKFHVTHTKSYMKYKTLTGATNSRKMYSEDICNPNLILWMR